LASARSRAVLPAVLAALGALLLVTAIPGVFIIDEPSYLATVTGLRDGTLAVPGTAGLPPSPELISFDAAAPSRVVTSTPVYSSSPPLYAPFALPFAAAGLYGLIALQVLAFLVTAYLVFAFTRRETGDARLAWLALATFVLAGFTIEYAQAIWPHVLSVMFAMLAVDLASRLRGGATLWLAPLAGACAGLATGMRYQNVALAAMIAVSLVWCARGRRARAALAFALGCAVPLAASAAMNAHRFGSWNPVSKGPSYHVAYASFPRTRSVVEIAGDAVASSWSRIVDYSTWPDHKDAFHKAIMPKDPDTGVFVLHGALKKALLQSAPWVIIPLVAMGLAWRRRGAGPPERRRELRALSLVVGGVLGMFALFGYTRMDGWCFNQRYLLELVPLFAIGLAMALDAWRPRWRDLAIGAAAAAVVAVAIYQLEPSTSARQLLLMKLPILLAAAVAASWLLARAGRVRLAVAGGVLGAALGWAAAVHVGDDLRASRFLRASNARWLARFRDTVPAEPPAAVFVYSGLRDGLAPLTLERDLVIVDPWVDGGEDAPRMRDALLAQGRVVYIVRQMPSAILASLVEGRRVIIVPGTRWLLRVTP
jgi:hypothetical protein